MYHVDVGLELGLFYIIRLKVDVSFNLIFATVKSPTFATQPSSQTVNLCQYITFSCSATGYNVKYQWTIGSGSFPSKIVGINTNTLVIPDVRSSDDNTYTCVASNDGGCVTSDPAKLAITGKTTKYYNMLLRTFW